MFDQIDLSGQIRNSSYEVAGQPLTIYGILVLIAADEGNDTLAKVRAWLQARKCSTQEDYRIVKEGAENLRRNLLLAPNSFTVTEMGKPVVQAVRDQIEETQKAVEGLSEKELEAHWKKTYDPSAPAEVDYTVWMNDPSQPKCLRDYLRWGDLNASQQYAKREAGEKEPVCWATLKSTGERVRLCMVSRFGDVGINTTGKDSGYRDRVTLNLLTDFSERKEYEAAAETA